MGKKVLTENAIRAGYGLQYGVLASYLPQDKNLLDKWLEELLIQVGINHTDTYEPSVQALQELIERNGIVRMYVTKMIDEVPDSDKKIFTIDQLLEALNYIIQHAPTFLPLTVHFPMSALFVYMMFTPAGEVAFRLETFNNAIRAILQQWCSFLDSPASLSVINKEDGWLSHKAYETNKLYEFIIPDEHAPHGGFASFNAYFHRQIKPECRPVAEPGNSKIIVSPNDGTVYNIACGVKRSDTFWIKSQPYSLNDMLNGLYTDQFVGGDVFQAFLSGADYHRWRSPVDGIILATRIVDGLMFSELHSEGFDPDAGIFSQSFEASVNTRGLVFIHSDDPTIGLVCVIPIGITEISSVTIEVMEGQRVKKGEELGYFSYGGSTLCTVFQPGAIRYFTKEVPGQKPPQPLPDVNIVQANAQMAVAN